MLPNFRADPQPTTMELPHRVAAVPIGNDVSIAVRNATTLGPNLCNMCNNPGVLCPGCDNSRYCSVECRWRDWPMHKHLCKSFQNFQHKPSPNVYRAILFPVNEPSPRFIWLEHAHRAIGEQASNETLADILGSQPYSADLWFDCNRRLRRQYNFFVSLTHTSIPTLAMPNRSLSPLVGPPYVSDWRGTFIAHGNTGTLEDMMKEKRTYGVDLDTTNLRPIVESLVWRSRYRGMVYNLSSVVKDERT